VVLSSQTRDVTIWRMLSAGTIEEKMLQRQLFKSDLASGVISEGGGGGASRGKGGGSGSSGGGGGGGRTAENKFSPEELKALFRYDARARCDTLALLLTAAGRSDEFGAMTAPEQWLPPLPDPTLRDAVETVRRQRQLRALPFRLLVGLYKVLFHSKALLWESVILLPPLTCTAYPIAILLHDQCGG